PPESRRSTGWDRGAAGPTPATNSCRSRICRRGRPSSLPSSPRHEGPVRMSRPRLVVRELREHADYAAARLAARRGWRMDDLQVPSTFDLQVAGHIGGMTAGAFDGGVLAGFVHGFPRTNLGRPSHHSHLLAVLPEFRGRGLSVRLKLFQRRWCLAHGV